MTPLSLATSFQPTLISITHKRHKMPPLKIREDSRFWPVRSEDCILLITSVTVPLHSPLHPALMSHLIILPPVSHHHLLKLLMPVVQFLLPLHSELVSVWPWLLILNNICLHLPISFIVSTIFYLTTRRKMSMTNAMMVNDEKKNIIKLWT